MERKLLDSYEVSGSDVEQFRKELKEFDASTKVLHVSSSDLALLSKAEDTDERVVPIFWLNPGNPFEVSPKGNLSLNKKTFKKSSFTDVPELLNEFENNSKLMIQAPDGTTQRCYFTSKELNSTLGIRTGVAGDAMVEPSLERDILLASRLGLINSDISLITRSTMANGKLYHKIFAALSGKYSYIKQSYMFDILDKVKENKVLGEMKCYNWRVSNQFAEIYVEFPEKAKEISSIYELDREIIPGMYISKSDVGECSVTVRATARIGRATLTLDEFKKRHSGKIDTKEILDVIDHMVFEKYTKLPERLCELMTIDITNPSWESKLTHEDFMKLNNKIMEETIKFVFKEIGVVQSIGKKREKIIRELLINEIDPEISYTAYDVVIMIMDVTTRLSGLSKNLLTNLSKTTTKAAYVDFGGKKEEEIVLTA